MGHRLRSTVTVVASVATLLVLVAAPAAHASRAGDTATARQGVLVKGDFPTGWNGTRSQAAPDATVIKQASKVKACADYVALRKLTVNLPKARSLEFDDGTTSKMSNVVNAFASARKVSDALALFSKATVPTCLEQVTQKAAGSQVKVAVRAADVSGLGSDAVGYTADITDNDGALVDQLLTFAVPVGRYISVYTVDVQSAEAPLATLDAAVGTSITRLQNATK
jgi:hypothetical protein